MSDYPFRLIKRDSRDALTDEDRQLLGKRPFVNVHSTLVERARDFIVDERLEDAMNTAIAVGQPLLLTGEPGCGKTQASHYLAYKLGVDIFEFQVKSDSIGRDLLYDFDQIAYFRDANARAFDPKTVKKEDYVHPRVLWKAIEYAEGKGTPAVVLIDEIDKAPRDFPNDLLHELDEMTIRVVETGGEPIQCEKGRRPIVVITSNEERRLPDPFLRRCVYHHIQFSEDVLRKAVGLVGEGQRYLDFSEGFLNGAIQRFLDLRDRAQGKKPSTSELLAWLQVLKVATGGDPAEIDRKEIDKLPGLSTLIKDAEGY